MCVSACVRTCVCVCVRLCVCACTSTDLIDGPNRLFSDAMTSCCSGGLGLRLVVSVVCFIGLFVMITYAPSTLM